MSTDTVTYFLSVVEYKSLQSVVERGRKGEDRQGSREGDGGSYIFNQVGVKGKPLALGTLSEICIGKRKRRKPKCLFRFFLEQNMNFIKVLEYKKQRRISG